MDDTRGYRLRLGFHNFVSTNGKHHKFHGNMVQVSREKLQCDQDLVSVLQWW